MPGVHLLRSETELYDAIKTKTPLGYVVIHYYQEGFGTNGALEIAFRDVSNHATFSSFFKADADEIGEEILQKFGVVTLPYVVVYFGGEAKRKYDVETRGGLINAMKNAGVLKESDQL